MNKFWLIWREGGHYPTKKHFSREDAILEAGRLAQKQAGDEFYVAEVQICIKATAIVTTTLLGAE
jgi:hypothetical protein